MSQAALNQTTANNSRILIVEDDIELREALTDTLELAGLTALTAESGEAALRLLSEQSADLVISDINMGRMDGHALLEQLQHSHPGLPVVLMTAFGDVSGAVSAMRNGAVDYLVKPFKPQMLVEVVKRHALGTVQAGDQPIAEEHSSKQLLQLAQKVADTDSTVLISGESGTGKEVLARYIHDHSPRANKPFIAINCAAIPENMLEATLFGHEKGAFTGAYAAHAGKFEQADGGTILLDEVSEMALGLQAKLLRVLQEREVERVGGKKVIELDVRVIATTNRDLMSHVGDGQFREDLYYRLSVFPLQWLPLRERPADIVPLAQRLIGQHAAKMNQAPAQLDDSAIAKLTSYQWPGNVRELDNAVQRALILQRGGRISGEDLLLNPMGIKLTSAAAPAASAEPLADSEEDADQGLGGDLMQREFELIISALKTEHGRKNKAAEKLGISPRTLRYKMAKMREMGMNLEAALG